MARGDTGGKCGVCGRHVAYLVYCKVCGKWRCYGCQNDCHALLTRRMKAESRTDVRKDGADGDL